MARLSCPLPRSPHPNPTGAGFPPPLFHAGRSRRAPKSAVPTAADNFARAGSGEPRPAGDAARRTLADNLRVLNPDIGGAAAIDTRALLLRDFEQPDTMVTLSPSLRWKARPMTMADLRAPAKKKAAKKCAVM